MAITEQDRLRVTTQRSRTIHTKIQLLDYDFTQFGEDIDGVVLDGATFTIDANSDIRRTCSISFIPNKSNLGVGYGKGVWLDKYVKIFVGIEDNLDPTIIQYTNMGIYIINNPEQVYDAVQNIITISGIDMMAKITGLRNGNLIFGEDGQAQPATSYFVESGNGIKQVMTSTMEDCGWSGMLVDIDQPTPTILTPMDMTFNLGSTAYNIISQLRDINSGYETYFDVDGIFHFRQIPYSLYAPWTQGDTLRTGVYEYKVYNKGDRCTYMSNGITYVYESKLNNNYNHIPTDTNWWSVVNHTMDSIFADDTLWDKVLISYSKNYDFENVKNYIEVFGKTQNDGNTPYGIAYDNNPNSPFYYGGTVGTINIVLSGGEYDNIYPLADYYSYVAVTPIGTENPFIEGWYVIDNYNYVLTYDTSIQPNVIYYKKVYNIDEFNSLAQQRAEWELFQRCRLQDQITLTCVPVYWLDVNKLVSITLPTEDEENPKTELYVIKNINTTLSVDGTQQITLMKYYPLYS